MRVLAVTVTCTSVFFAFPTDVARASGTADWDADGSLVAETENTGWAAGGQIAIPVNEVSIPHAVTSDGSYVYAWYDTDAGQVRAQKLDASGAPQWGTNGVLAYASATETLYGAISAVPDTVGGVILVFYTAETFYNIRAQRLGPTGAYQWVSTGATVVADGSENSYGPTAVEDGSNGVVVAWMRGNSSTNADIRAQRLNGAGSQQWTSTGVVISAAANEQINPVAVTDGSGGAIIGWEDHRSGDANTDIYAQRVNTSGTVQWTANGVVISNATANQDRMTSATADGSGGAVFVWEDNRTSGGSAGVYAQKINSSGTVQWTANGVAVDTDMAFLTNPKVAMSATNTMIAYAIDDGGETDVYIQKLNASGTKMFEANGKRLTATASVSEYVNGIVEAGDGSNDVILTFGRGSGSTTVEQIRAQKVTIGGSVSWSADGVVALVEANSTSYHPAVRAAVLSNSGGDAIVMFAREDGNDTVAQRLQSSDGAPQWNSTEGVLMPDGAAGAAPQTGAQVVSDGAGGYIFAWNDKRRRSGKTDIFAQKLNASGAEQWTLGGESIIATGDDDGVWTLIADGAGGALIAFTTYVGSDSYIRVIRIESDGDIAAGWSGSGTALSPSTSTEFMDMVSDGASGAIVIYRDTSNGGQIFANRVTSAGATPWGATGVELSQNTANPGHNYASAAADGSGGAYVAWFHQNNDTAVTELRMVRIDSSGSVVSGWTSGGTTVAIEDTASNPDVAVTSDGYAVVAWYENPSSDSYIMAQKYSAAGASQWTANGIEVVDETGNQTSPRIVASDTGAIVAWNDFRNGNDYDIYAQRLESAGTLDWTASGVEVVTAAEEQALVGIDTDEVDGAVFGWYDYRAGDGYSDMYAQRLDVTGNAEWTVDGIALADRANKDENSGFDAWARYLVSDGDAGVVVAFGSENDDATAVTQARAQHVTDSEGAGGPAPTNDPTLSNAVTMTRLKVNTASTVSISFELQNELTGTFTATFPVGFTVTGAMTSGSCSGGGTVDTFAFDGPSRTMTAEKHACSGVLTLSGGTVVTPGSPGLYFVTWTNDDPGEGGVAIVDDDQVTVTAQVDSSITFDLDTATTDTESSAPYSVSLGAITTSDTRVSGATDAVNFIWLDLDTNAGAGAVVTVRNANGASGLVSTAVPADAIASADGAVADGTENYGLCSVTTSDAGGNLDALAPFDGTCAADTEGNTVGGFTGSAQQIYDTDSAPIAGGRAQIAVQASISATTPAHNDYTDTLTFIATGTF